ncbi:MAG: glutamate 5-kinase [Candidatus Geothermincolia bacterium]
MEKMKRMVIKVGTATITEASGRLSRERVKQLTEAIKVARERGVDVALVSSGAIAAGLEKLGMDARPSDVETLQAVAAVGQGILVRKYTDMFAAQGITTGQVLLTQHDITHRQQYLNARRTLERLFRMGVVPVINENDTVSTEELTFGDNDMLGALVASLVGADLLVLLTDTEGLFTCDPRKRDDAKLIDRVERVTEEIEELAGEAGELGLGGMSSKVQAAKAAVSTGVSVIIADGRTRSTITDILDGKEPGTFFVASGKVTSRKHWIGYARIAKGKLVIDEGAARALQVRRKSLLPAGVVGVEGEFDVGDCVDIVDPAGKVIARGLTSYGSDEAKRIAGLRSTQVKKVLGETGEEIVNRDELVVF